MIFWLFVILLVVGIVLWCVSVDKSLEVLESLSGDLAIAFGVVITCMLIAIIINYSTAIGEKSEYVETYKALTYKAQTESIRDEFGVVNKDYIDEVQEWNEMVVKKQAIMNNKWTYIFVPKSVYKDLQTIDYNSIQMKK